MRLTILLIVSLLACQAGAATYYVGNDGNDSNDGLGQGVGNAWLTMWKMGQTVDAGDTCWVLGGTYDENNSGFPNVNGTLRFANAGVDGDSIWIMGHPDSSRPIIYGNSDPASTTHRWSLYLAEANDYFHFRFLKFEYGHKAVRLGGADYITFRDCISTHNISTAADENGGGWLTGWDAGVSYGIVWYNCEAGPARLGASWNTGSTDQNLSGWHLYKCWYSVIDSCRLTPSNDSLQAGVFFKVNNYHDTVRNCTFDDGASYVIRYDTRSDVSAPYIITAEDSAGQIYVHDNFIANSPTAVTMIQSSLGYTHVVDTFYFFNNTVYNMSTSGIKYSSSVQCPVDSIYKEHHWFNNIWYNSPTSGTDASHAIAEVNFIDITTVDFDYNCFFGGTNFVGDWDDGGGTNLATWQSNSGEDANSQLIDPALANPASGDFSLTGASPAFVTNGGTIVDGFGHTWIGADAPAADSTVVQIDGNVEVTGNAKLGDK